MRPPRRRGQALAEFAISVVLLVTIALSTLNLVPALRARGAALEAAVSVTERLHAYQAPAERVYDPATGKIVTRTFDATALAAERTIVCAQLYVVAAALMRGQGFPAQGSSACAGGPNGEATLSGTANLAVYAVALDPSGKGDHARRLAARWYNPDEPDADLSQPVRACVTYRWTPSSPMILWFMAAIDTITRNSYANFVFRYCGDTTIDPYRSR